ncbi:NHL repeat-containing protein [Anaeromyxobacter sp. PSR-1]|uniref:NHL repeat-containing protein n=1 Tax=Anaeromyxobacter sp. PSR-1 TaxID=1300915 RepID=UPI0005DBAA2C|nr:NHL repeat-containing protein [Anaeromyxobacter sp. PSR-1]GAO02341.1 E3 ubiquitin-protein ligase TRIM71 [Anaeromyxobacter sp. PSR-1]
MSRAIVFQSVLGLAMVFGPAVGAAQAFRHQTTVYSDPKEGQLRRPEGVACGAGGAVVVADTGNARLLLYTYRDGSLSGGTQVKLAQVPYPYRVQLDPKGEVLVLDEKLRKIVRLDAKGAFLGNVDLQGAPAGTLPGAFKVDGAGNLYVLDVLGPRVLVTDPAGKVIRQVELPREGAQFTDVAVDGGGTLYAVDAVGAGIWTADKGATAFKRLTESRKDVMSFPTYLAFHQGKLYVVDQHGGGIAILGSDGSFQGRQLALGWSPGLVYYPAQICFEPDGAVFVADRGNDRIQVFDTGR